MWDRKRAKKKQSLAHYLLLAQSEVGGSLLVKKDEEKAT